MFYQAIAQLEGRHEENFIQQIRSLKRQLRKMYEWKEEKKERIMNHVDNDIVDDGLM
jgi:hypothetical protein